MLPITTSVVRPAPRQIPFVTYFSSSRPEGANLVSYCFVKNCDDEMFTMCDGMINIGYKIAACHGGFLTYGSILHELNAPINDLGYGWNAEDVYQMRKSIATQK